MQDDNGLIAIYIPIGTGKRATRVKLPGDCTLVGAEYGGLSQVPRYPNSGPDKRIGSRPQAKLLFRLVEKYDRPVERLFRVVNSQLFPDLFPAGSSARSMGTVAQIRHPENKDPNAIDWEVIEMERHDVGTRVSDIQKMTLVRGLNRLVFEHAQVVRVNGCEVASKQLKIGKDGLFGREKVMLGGQRRHKQAGRQPLQWELRYQTRRRLKGDVGWAFIGTSADEADGFVPARLKLWRTLRTGLHIWLSENLYTVANE